MRGRFGVESRTGLGAGVGRAARGIADVPCTSKGQLNRCIGYPTGELHHTRMLPMHLINLQFDKLRD